MTDEGKRVPTEPPVETGDPWIDAYLKLRHAWLANPPTADLLEYAQELRLTLPGPPPGKAADIFIHMDVAIAGITPALVTVLTAPGSPLWTPNRPN